MTDVVGSGADSGQNVEGFFNTVVYENLLKIGCCKMCSLRLCGETKIAVYQDLNNKLEERRQPKQNSTDIENGIKKVARNACIACLGMLQPPMCDKIIEKIVEAVSREDYDNPTFCGAFTLPVSFYLRAHALMIFLVNNFPEHVGEHLPLGLVTVGVKDAWKYVFTERLSQRINKTFSHDSDFKIQVDIQYEDNQVEIDCLHKMYPNKFKEQKIKTRKLRHLKGPTLQFSRKSVESVLTLEERERFAQFYPIPPIVPTHSATCNNVFFEHSSIYLGGRYNKYLRGLPQTAWLIQDQRKMETSVHELIVERVQELTKAQGSKLISSGREDVDVRMLGSGRPFALELISPRHVTLSKQELNQLEHTINTEGAGMIAVSHLQVVPKLSLEILKKGEEKKSKIYEAYCVAWGADEARLESVVERAPLILQQKTPIRVLHRRPIATRPKTVHWMAISNVKHLQADNTTHFKLKLKTQAGTYIKEFIHGDFGRTKPSLGDLLGGVTADCLALDVVSIELDWPPT